MKLAWLGGGGEGVRVVAASQRGVTWPVCLPCSVRQVTCTTPCSGLSFGFRKLNRGQGDGEGEGSHGAESRGVIGLRIEEGD